MKILVTGGAGFIGSALAERLIRDNHEIVVIDNFNEYYDVELKRKRVEALLSKVAVIEGDITDKNFLTEIFEQNKFDVVCHLAAQAGVRYSVEHPEVYVTTNVLGTQMVFEAMKEFGVKRMVYASTSSAYGVTATSPFKEEEKADRPVSVYAATKRAGEMIAHSYYAMYGIETTCLRFFTVYGPWSRPDMAMFKFADKMMTGKPIDIYNKGDLRRDFTYIDDIVEGFVKATMKPLGYEIVNLGSGKPIELLSFVEQLEDVLGVKAKKNLLPMQPGDVFETYADITKAKELLGFESQMDFETGIHNFSEWFTVYRS